MDRKIAFENSNFAEHYFQLNNKIINISFDKLTISDLNNHVNDVLRDIY